MVDASEIPASRTLEQVINDARLLTEQERRDLLQELLAKTPASATDNTIVGKVPTKDENHSSVPSGGSATFMPTLVDRAGTAQHPVISCSESAPVESELVLGHLRMEECIGSGGMGFVLRAEDLNGRRNAAELGVQEPRGRSVAVKVAQDDDPDALAAFRREALRYNLTHPNILAVYSQGNARISDTAAASLTMLVRAKNPRAPPVRSGMYPFIEMELLQNATTLETLLTGRETKPRVSRATLLKYFLEVCDAIKYAHKNRVVHRDLKPANVMVDDYGRARVLDWGLAKEIGAQETSCAISAPPDWNASTTRIDLTQAGTIKGTPRYMSPEQARGQSAGYATDVYSLGVILYEMLTGKRPHSAFEEKSLLDYFAVLTTETTSIKPPTKVQPADYKLRILDELQGIESSEYATVPCRSRWRDLLHKTRTFFKRLMPQRKRLFTEQEELDCALDTVVMGALEKDPAKRISLDELITGVRAYAGRQTVLLDKLAERLAQQQYDDATSFRLLDSGIADLEEKLTRKRASGQSDWQDDAQALGHLLQNKGNILLREAGSDPRSKREALDCYTRAHELLFLSARENQKSLLLAQEKIGFAKYNSQDYEGCIKIMQEVYDKTLADKAYRMARNALVKIAQCCLELGKNPEKNELRNKGLRLFYEQLQLAQNHHSDQVYRARLSLAEGLINLNMYEPAHAELEQALACCPATDLRVRGLILDFQGMTLLNLGNNAAQTDREKANEFYTRAEKDLEEALCIFKKTNDADFMYDAAKNIDLVRENRARYAAN